MRNLHEFGTAPPFSAGTALLYVPASLSSQMRFPESVSSARPAVSSTTYGLGGIPMSSGGGQPVQVVVVVGLVVVSVVVVVSSVCCSPSKLELM